MTYRKKSPQPTRLLLRVAATAGAIGAAACGSERPTTDCFCGNPALERDGAAEAAFILTTGVLPYIPDGGSD